MWVVTTMWLVTKYKDLGVPYRVLGSRGCSRPYFGCAGGPEYLFMGFMCRLVTILQTPGVESGF